jgi:hypothetical protein
MTAGRCLSWSNTASPKRTGSTFSPSWGGWRENGGVMAPINWGVTEDAADPERIVEWFMVESWAEHLRQHKRVSRADADLQSQALKYHMAPEPPRVGHYLALETSGSKRQQ